MDETTTKVERLEVIQLKAGHDCEGCLAIVDEPKVFGCVAFIMVPMQPGMQGKVYLRLNESDYVRLGAWIHAESISD